MRWIVVLFCLFILALPSSASDVAWPGETWSTATPESEGIDSEKLANALIDIRKTGMNIHSLLVIRHGRKVLDARFYPYDGKVPHELASVTKSVMTTLIAIAADQGKLDLDQPMLSFFPDRKIANRDARKERVTVRHLTGMTSGLHCTPDYDEETLRDMVNSPDWIQFVLDRPMAAEPGERFVYCSPGMHLLSAILQKATGMKTLDFARASLFEPLGITEVIWPSDPQGITHGWGDIRLFPEDAARIGYLWFRDGKWKDREIVSADWVRHSASLQAKTGEDDDYGYGWWIMTGDEIPQYSAIGRGGLRIGVLPTLDMVYVTTGGGFEPAEATDRLAPALIDMNHALAGNPAASAKLEAALKHVAEPPAAVDPHPLPAGARLVSGKTYVLDPNPYQLKSMRLDFTALTEAGLSLQFLGGAEPVDGAVGLDGVYRMTTGRFGLPLGLRGQWSDEHTFALEYDEIANRDAYRLEARFLGDKVILSIKERTHQRVVTIVGRQQ